MQNYKVDMGMRIKEKRKELKLTQEMLAEMLGISVKHLSEVERGIAGLSIDNLVHLSYVFDVSIDYLIKGSVSESRWNATMMLLQGVPEDKEYKVKELIRNIIDILEK